MLDRRIDEHSLAAEEVSSLLEADNQQLLSDLFPQQAYDRLLSITGQKDEELECPINVSLVLYVAPDNPSVAAAINHVEAKYSTAAFRGGIATEQIYVFQFVHDFDKARHMANLLLELINNRLRDDVCGGLGIGKSLNAALQRAMAVLENSPASEQVMFNDGISQEIEEQIRALSEEGAFAKVG